MARKVIINGKIYEETGTRKIIVNGRIYDATVATAQPLQNKRISSMHFQKHYHPTAVGE